MAKKAQGSLEQLIILSAVLLISGAVVLTVSGVFSGETESVLFASCKQAAQNCRVIHAADPTNICDFCLEQCVDPSSAEPISDSAIGCCQAGEPDSVREDFTGTCQYTAPVCGNSVCEQGESPSNCPSDCSSGIDGQAPVIESGPSASTTKNTATITWTTNEYADSKVEYGLDTTYGSEKSDSTMVLSHSVILTGLTIQTTYHYKVISKDPSGNTVMSSDYTFTTKVCNSGETKTGCTVIVLGQSCPGIQTCTASGIWGPCEDIAGDNCPEPDDSEQACLDATDRTPGDEGIGWGADLFGAGYPNCCGDDSLEWYLEDQFYESSSLWVYDGCCLNMDYCIGSSPATKCVYTNTVNPENKHVLCSTGDWYECTSSTWPTRGCQKIDNYWCTFTLDDDPGLEGIRWRDYLPVEVCDDTYDNDCDGDTDDADSDCWSWRKETVDSAGDVGKWTSITVDPTYDTPHISYYDVTNKDLKLAYRTGTTWGSETVMSGGDVGEYSSIAIDSNLEAVMSYYNRSSGDLQYAYMGGVGRGWGWVSDTVDSTGNVGFGTSLALAPGNIPHIAYYDLSNKDLKYAYKDATGWHIEIADTVGGANPSIILDSSNKPHIAYYDETNKDLRYAYKDASGWHTETVDTTNSVGLYPSLYLDSHNKPHISYYYWSGGDLKYANKSGSVWNKYILHAGTDIGWYSSIVLDSENTPHISYYDGEKDDLRYTKYDNSKKIDSAGDIGRYNSITIDSNGYLHVSYRDDTNDDLKYAYRAP